MGFHVFINIVEFTSATDHVGGWSAGVKGWLATVRGSGTFSKHDGLAHGINIETFSLLSFTNKVFHTTFKNVNFASLTDFQTYLSTINIDIVSSTWGIDAVVSHGVVFKEATLWINEQGMVHALDVSIV